MPGHAKSAAVARRVIAALDGDAMGRIYCDQGGDAFWLARRGPVVELGLRWARQLERRLPRSGQSFYVGAGVAELPCMLVESLELGRDVVACSLRGEECHLLNAALADAGLDLRIRHEDARSIAVAADHVSLVSVLTDPESFPTVSGLTYGRTHPATVDVARFAREAEAARGLVAAVLDRLRLPGLVTTTVEEVPWVLAWADGAAATVAADDQMVPTALVGDPIGFLRVRAAS